MKKHYYSLKKSLSAIRIRKSQNILFQSIKYYKRIESKTLEKEYILSDDPIKIYCLYTRYQGAVLDEIKKGNIDSAQSCKGSDALKTIKSINNLLSNQWMKN